MIKEVEMIVGFLTILSRGSIIIMLNFIKPTGKLMDFNDKYYIIWM